MERKVQEVSKASSEELLRKFAETGSDSEDELPSVTRRRRKSSIKHQRSEIGTSSEGDDQSLALSNRSSCETVERKSLLGGGKQRSTFRRLGIGKYGSRLSHHHHAKNRSILCTIEKTWSKAVRGASRVFMEQQFNRHRRLNSADVVTYKPPRELRLLSSGSFKY